MPEEIEKSDQPNPDDVLTAIQSFNDPAIITNIFRELGWSYSLEIKETLIMAKQNANLSIKFKAIKHLRELLREAAESAGYIANVSSTAPNAQGGHTTFHAKRIAGALNPVKKIESTEIKEPKDDKTEETKSDRRSDRGESQDTGDAFSSSEGCPGATNDSKRNGKSGVPEPSDDGEAPRPVPRERRIGEDSTISGTNKGTVEIADETTGNRDEDNPDNPCIKTRPPTCDQDLFPGIASAED